MKKIKTAELTLDHTVKSCRYRADLPCRHPLLRCEKCPDYIPEEKYGLLKRSCLGEIAKLVPDHYPIVSVGRRRNKLGIEVGIKGTF